MPMRNGISLGFHKVLLLMPELNGWDVVLLAVAGYVAVMSLVRMMQRRHRQRIDELRQEFQQEQHRRRLVEKAEKKRQKRAAAKRGDAKRGAA